MLTLTPRLFEPGLFDLTERSPVENQPPARRQRVPNKRSDEALVLHTSGTSGAKKVVPYTVQTLVTGAGCIMMSWGLRASDCALIMMPLFHVGGEPSH